MLVTPLLFALFACIAFAEQTTIYHDGVFSGLLYDSSLTQKDGTTTLSFAYPSSACVSSLSVEATEKSTAVLETITRHNQGIFVWGEVARTEVENGKGTIALPEPKCASRYRLVLSNGVIEDVVVESEKMATLPATKREVSCTGSAGQWPKECGTAPEGQICLETESCGCKEDADCFGNAVLPFCIIDQRICASCFTPQRTGTDANGRITGIVGAKLTNFSGHYFCRNRYPTRYLSDKTNLLKEARPVYDKVITIPAERTPDLDDPGNQFGGYFREVCAAISPDPSVKQGTNTLGSCERCDQAAYLADIWLPKYDFVATALVKKPNEGPKGTYFCRFIRGLPQAGINDMNVVQSRDPSPFRPICSTKQYFIQVGLGDLWDKLSASEEVRTVGFQSFGSPPYEQNAIRNYTLDNWEGACVPCFLYHPDGTRKAYHGLCSFALALNNVSGQDIKISTPICSSATGGCIPCASNEACQLGDETSGPFKTGGPNCMTAGHCIYCRSDNDCVGDLGDQPVCGAGGICVARQLCNANNDETGTVKCATNTLGNCQKSGECADCRVSGCGNDGGIKADQQVCDQANGICRSCTTNAQCANLGNARNCYTDGVCRDCTAVGCDNDGGQPGAIGGCSGPAGSQFCTEKASQPLCNAATRQCEDICVSNDFCASRTTVVGLAGGGANCQADGHCLSCSPVGGSTANPAATCGNLDGPQVNLPGRSGLNAETNCGVSGICFNEARCAKNADCPAIGGGNNCQTSGGCISCSVTYDTTTCSAADGGEVAGQVNCNQASRLCVGGCNSENDCIGTQGANCMANKVCFDCRSNDDCRTNNAWGGDRIQRTICVNKLCTPACDANYQAGGTNPCGSDAPNCNNDGVCIRCTATSCANDGPPGRGGNTVCDASGICVNPWLCTNGGSNGQNADNIGCQQHYNDGNHQNCNIDGSCTNCVNNAGCQANDGGAVSYQPRCDPTDHVCKGCTSNDDCPMDKANCQNDGSCRDCRLETNAFGQCANDGPPSLGSNRNCDPLTGICVDFCVRDADCTDACKPRCQLERGCCVECNSDNDCPVKQWRSTEMTKTRCDTNLGYQCVAPATCQIDEDCARADTAQQWPACAQGQDVCVECTSDFHCANRPGKACSVGRQKCVVCTSNNHCLEPNTRCDVRTNYCVWASGFTMTASLVLSLVMIFVSVF